MSISCMFDQCVCVFKAMMEILKIFIYVDDLRKIGHF